MPSDSIPFELWLETETGEPKDQLANRSHENFCNVGVTLADGRRYALNVWTFDFLPLARFPWPHDANDDAKAADYVLPPDIFVERLDRDVIHRVITELLATDQMKTDWLVDECD